MGCVMRGVHYWDSWSGCCRQLWRTTDGAGWLGLLGLAGLLLLAGLRLVELPPPALQVTKPPGLLRRTASEDAVQEVAELLSLHVLGQLGEVEVGVSALATRVLSRAELSQYAEHTAWGT